MTTSNLQPHNGIFSLSMLPLTNPTQRMTTYVMLVSGYPPLAAPDELPSAILFLDPLEVPDEADSSALVDVVAERLRAITQYLDVPVEQQGATPAPYSFLCASFDLPWQTTPGFKDRQAPSPGESPSSAMSEEQYVLCQNVVDRLGEMWRWDPRLAKKGPGAVMIGRDTSNLVH